MLPVYTNVRGVAPSAVTSLLDFTSNFGHQMSSKRVNGTLKYVKMQDCHACWDWISGSPVSPPLCAWGLQTQVHFWTEGAVPCGAGGGVDGGAAVPSMLTDRRSIYFLLCLFSYVYSTLSSVLGYPERRYIN